MTNKDKPPGFRSVVNIVKGSVEQIAAVPVPDVVGNQDAIAAKPKASEILKQPRMNHGYLQFLVEMGRVEDDCGVMEAAGILAACANDNAIAKAKPTTQPPPPLHKKDVPTSAIIIPFWREEERGTPNAVVRSSLFAAIYGNKNRKQMKDVVIYTQGDVNITYTGEQLSQTDKDIFLAAVQLVREQGQGNTCAFTGYEFLKLLDKSDNADNYKVMQESIDRLIACFVRVRVGSYTFTGSIISSCEMNKETDKYELTFDPKFLRMYETGWTAINWEQHNKLTRSPLAQWIYDYAVTHVGSTISKDLLKKLSGREDEAPREFNRSLKRAQELLEGTQAATLSVDTKGLITISHALSESQQKHVAKKKATRTTTPKKKPPQQNQ